MAGTSEAAVSVVVGRRKATIQPQTFRLCPLGLQFYTSRPPALFSLLEVKFALPVRKGKPKQVQCTGAVVHVQPDKFEKKYRVWLQFLDLPAECKERLACHGRSSNFLCPYCENF